MRKNKANTIIGLSREEFYLIIENSNNPALVEQYIYKLDNCDLSRSAIELINEEGLSDDFDDVLEKNLLLQKINKSLKGSISQINPNQKEVISLFYFEGFSYMEISEVTGLTNKEVKSHIKNGKKAIKSFMNNSEKK